MLKHGILGLLNYKEMTGYEIMLVFRDSLRFFWSAHTSQIYRELQALEAKGWAKKTPVPQHGKPDKNIYAISPKGRKELLRWLSEGELGLETRSPILMKVFFFGEQKREESIRYFKALKEYCHIFLEALNEVPGHIEAYSVYLDDPEKAAYWQMTVDYGRRNMRMHMDWAQSCIEKLENGAERGG